VSPLPWCRDPHVWLSPENGKIIAKNIRDALVEAAPEHRETFDSNYDDLAARIDRLDRELVGIIERAKAEGVKVIFVQPQFSVRSAETAAEAIGGAVVPIDPLSENWLENLRGIGNTIRSELTEAE
jgi:zinc transport system substrate-binding protein